MAEMMNFPKRWEDFLHDYEFEDARRIYTNGSRLIPSFRVKQMMEHYAPVRHGRWIEQEKYTFGVLYDCSICGNRILDNGHSWNYCPNCGADMRGSNDEGVTVREWISVDDRLPGKEEYTATTEYGTEYYIRLLIAYKTDTVEYEIGYYDGYKWMTGMPIRLIKDVVAWMPFPNMPQPPKEAEEDDHE